MTGFSTDTAARVRQAITLARARRFAEARGLLERLTAEHPDSSDLRNLYGVVLHELGERRAALGELERAAELSPANPRFAVSYGRALAEAGRTVEAEVVFRNGLSGSPADRDLLASLLVVLRSRERWPEIDAVGSTVPIEPSTVALHSFRAEALRRLGRSTEAAALLDRLRSCAPDDPGLEFERASVLCDLGRWREALKSIAVVEARGAVSPELLLLKGRALTAIGTLDEAEATYRAVLTEEPDHLPAHRELSQLLWMRTGDAESACDPIRAGLRADPEHTGLLSLLAQVLGYTGNSAAAYEAAERAVRTDPGSTSVRLLAAGSAAEAGEAAQALAHAQAAVRSAPASAAALGALCQAQFRSGRIEEAAETAGRFRAAAGPDDQLAVAVQATAWRLLGDPAYREVYDYERFVRVYRLPVPEGWSSLDAYLADFAAHLETQQRFRSHPFGQSTRNAGQTMHSLLHDPEPVVSAFFQAVGSVIDRYASEIGEGEDPLRRRNTGRWRFSGAWSVLQRAGGRHVDHVHPAGWLSSAFYVRAPEVAVASPDRQGWIKFGEPGIPLEHNPGPEHWVRPEPGLLVLFPSYMWHGTVPFTTDETRMTVAFDVVPA